MLRPVFTVLLTSGLLVFLLLTSGCTLVYSAYIVNATDSPVFANLSYDWEGVRYEQEGALVRAANAVELQHHGNRILRVRDLAGATVALEHVGTEDTQLAVTELTPVTDAPALGTPPISFAPEGPSNSRRLICEDGDRKELPLFNLTITVFNHSRSALVASFAEDYQEEVEENQIRGVLVTAGGDSLISGEVLETGWLRAFDQEGQVAFTQELGRREFPVVAIPARLPYDPEPIPVFDNSSTCDIFSGVAAMGLGLGIAAAVVGAALYWRKRRRKRTAPLPSR